MASVAEQAVTDYLATYVTPERRGKIESVLAQRSRHLTVVVEDFHITQNASAILRTCEGLGIQDVHVVENQNSFKLNRDVTRGCNKWLTLHHYSDGQHLVRNGSAIATLPAPPLPAAESRPQNTALCLDYLQQQGYRLVATCPHEGAIAPEDLPLDAKVAILMGNEHAGLSDYALERADWAIKIPMAGFSESFNVSVSAAVCLYTLTRRLHHLQHWGLTAAEKQELRLQWYRQSARSSDRLEHQFLKQQGWLNP